MAYNLDAIKNQINKFQNGGKTPKKKSTGPKLPFFKPELGDNHIRFVPFKTPDGQPFYQVAYYSSELLVGDGWRQVAPYQYGEEDPIFDLLSELSQKRQPTEVFKLMNQLRGRESFYAPVLVRGQEDKGVQVWEMNSKRVKEVYAILAHPDYMDEDLFHPETGRDFVLKVEETDREFKGHAVKAYTISERKKASKLASTAPARKEILEGVPDFEAYFRGRLRTTDQYQTMLENALAGGPLDPNGTTTEVGLSRNEEGPSTEAAASIDDAFSDL